MGDAQRKEGLRILAADEDERTLARTDEILTSLGHTVTAHAISVAEAGDMISRDDPDLSVVVVDDDDEHALELIAEIGEYACGPVIALLASHAPDFIVRAAARRRTRLARPRSGVEVQGAIDVALRRHDEKLRLTAQVESLESALKRRVTIERAKGILMERHDVDDRGAFELLRKHARSSNRRVVDLAHAVVEVHPLLAGERSAAEAD